MLWETMLTAAHRITATSTPDGRGGVKPTYLPGEAIEAVFGYNSAVKKIPAEKADSVPQYIITTRKGVTLHYNEIIQRDSDGKLFKVLTDSEDNKSPNVSYINMQQVEAEAFNG